MYELFMFADRRSAPAFWLGSAFVVMGVLLHLPMFLMARAMHYRLAGMPMGAGMLWGMALHRRRGGGRRLRTAAEGRGRRVCAA